MNDRPDIDALVSGGDGVAMEPPEIPSVFPTLSRPDVVSGGSAGPRVAKDVQNRPSSLDRPEDESGQGAEQVDLAEQVAELQKEVKRLHKRVFPSWPRRIMKRGLQSIPPLMSLAFVILLVKECAPIKQDQLFACMDRVASSEDGDPEQSAELRRLLAEVVEEDSKQQRAELADKINSTASNVLIERVAAMHVCIGKVIPSSRADVAEDLQIWVDKNSTEAVSLD